MISIEELYQIYLQHPIICTDSRKITKQCLFFALSGERFDGNQFALSAIEQGAAYAIVDSEDLPEHPQLLHVEDTLLALQELAALHRATLSKPVIAITGTNGKTTTKELVAQVLSSTFNILYTEGNLNNHIGVPLTLLRLKDEHDFAIIEMGASKPGDIDELCQIAQPNYGIITNIGEAHLEGFQSIIGVERTKGELYAWLKEHDGKIIRKDDDERLARLGKGIPSVTYGQSSDAVIQGKLSEQNGVFLAFQWSAPAINIGIQEQTTQLVGAYNLDNALAAISLGLFFGIEPSKIVESIAAYKPQNSRSQFILTKLNNKLIADAYNANPSSMRSAITNFQQLSTELRKTLILGDMNELGASSEDAHHSIFNDLIEPMLSEDCQVILCGPIWTKLLSSDTRVTRYASASELHDALSLEPITDAFILLKGSHGIQLEKIINDL